ncbi:MAG: hypothetical protein LUF04_02995 [Bacteroides sp.]|nr:hypothetical protein [Bacteroides sp.]
MKKNSSNNRQSSFNPNRTCYLSSDGKYYCYEVWDSDAKRMVTQKLEIGKDLSEEWTIFLDDSDHQMDLGDRYETESRDPLFDAKVNSYERSDRGEETTDPWDTFTDVGNSPEEILFAEPEPENPDAVRVRQVIDEDCTEAQQNLFYDHFGSGIQLEEIRQTEAKRTGKLVSSAAMTNRKNKIIDKVAQSFGVERVKRHKYSSK